MKFNGSNVDLDPNDWNILKNLFFCVPQKKVSHTGLEWRCILDDIIFFSLKDYYFNNEIRK